MKKTAAIILTMCIALAMLNACGGKSDKGRVLERINAFFEAYNENDAYKMVLCFSEKERYADETYEDVEELLGRMNCDLYTYGKTVKAEVQSVGFPTTKEAFVNLNLFFEDVEDSVKWYMKMKKEGASWYIYTMYGE